MKYDTELKPVSKENAAALREWVNKEYHERRLVMGVDGLLRSHLGRDISFINPRAWNVDTSDLVIA